MTFLAMSTVQAVLLAVLTAGTIVALYFLKLRHRRVLVSSSILWRRVLDERQAHSLWEKLRKLLSIIVAVTIGLLIALALARPEIESLTGKNERIVLVLDTSPTMWTRTADGKTRWQRAVERARALLNSGGPTTQFQIVDTSGQTSFPLTTNRNEVRQMIDRVAPRAAPPAFPSIDAAGAQVYFISDGVATENVPAFARRISVFEPASNIGITAFEIRSTPSTPLSYEAYLEVQSYGEKSADVGITVSGPGGQRITRSTTLAPGEAFKEVFDLSRFGGGGIRATIQSENDSLPQDDVAFAYLPVKRKTRTLLVTRGNNYLETLLKLDSYVELLVADPGTYREAPNIDVYIFDRYAPPQPPPRPALIIGTPSAPWLRRAQGVVQKPAITTWAEDHPVMQYVSVHDLSIERAGRIDASDLTVIAASNQTPLIVASEKPKWVMLTFDLQSSDFPLHLGFPVFVENVLAWFGREQLALRRTVGVVEVPLSNAQIRTIDGRPVASRQELKDTVFEAQEPGLFTATDGDTRLQIAVNFANRNFSDVNRSLFQNDRAVAFERFLFRRELWFYMLVAAVLLIGVEWLTYHRRITL